MSTKILIKIKSRKIKLNYLPLIIIVATFLALFLIYLFAHDKFYLNLTLSEPRGIYQKIPFNGILKKGDLVIFQPPQAAKPYLYERKWSRPGTPLLKNVAALSGDTYQINEKAIFINEHYLGPIYHYDLQGLPLPKLRGSFTVKAGCFLPLSTYAKNSFDGRYFGEVAIKKILSKAKLIYKF